MEEGWIGDELDLSAFVPTKRMGIAFDMALVLVTLVYLALYLANGMTWLVSCAMLCIALLAVSLIYVLKGPDMRYIAINIVEITFFMVANVVFLGTDYGFQLYVFGFLTASMLLSLSAGGQGKVVLPTKVLIAILVAFYAAVTFWFSRNTPMYSFGDPFVGRVVFMLNSLTTMATIVLFTGVYMATAASLAGRLAEVASHDALTGLLNRRGFYPQVAKAYDRFAGTPNSCYVAMLDIDHFKDINDTYGHDGGDIVLKSLANLFVDYAKDWPGLQAARWGGEEFLLMYEPPQGEGAQKGLPFEPLRETISNMSVEFKGTQICCTVTVGVTDCIEGKTPDDIISLSDKRLYHGKQSGRNQVVLNPAA